MKFRASNPAVRPDADERRRRVDALLAHPIVHKALANERNRLILLKNNGWLTAEEMAGDRGKEVTAMVEKKP